MSEQTWLIRLAKGLTLETQNGDKVKGLPYKTQALVAVLALLSPEPVTRLTAGTILWPKASRSQRQANLRQAIRALRLATSGADFLLANRENLSLDLSLVNLVQVQDQDYLGQFSEPWFVLYRSSESAAVKATLEGTLENREMSVVRSLGDLLEWSATHQPDQAFGIISHSVDLATSLPPQRGLALSQLLLRQGSVNHPFRGWANLLHAFSLFFCLEMEAASREFHDLRIAALHRGDYELMAMSAFFEAACVLPMGGIDLAEAVISESSTVSSRRFSTRASLRLSHGSGLVACCRGDYSTGLASLKKVVELASQTGQLYECAYGAGNMAWIAASVGHVRAAKWALDAFEKADTGAHWRFQLTSDLARIHLLCTGGDLDSALILGEEALQFAQGLQAYGFEVYLRESLARCYALRGEAERSRQELAEAHQLRKRILWKLLPWDKDRLDLALRG
ncbi:MAG: hypothetical protein MUC92_05950 [Fimbriimonadaceae bacterium]|jgi:tetratricopeptide (TPR) repeat protein|nr:hypothetical protein [Fimbriimonadaceae bacterium]